MNAQVGDRIQVRAKTKRLAPSARLGTVEEVLDPAQPRYVVRWDDGRTTVIAPLPDTLVVIPKGEVAKKSPFAKEPAGPVTPRSTKVRSAPKKTKIRKH